MAAAGRPPAWPQRTAGWAITFVQRFGGLVKLNVHFHLLVPDGVFVDDEDGSRSRSTRCPPAPTCWRSSIASDAILETMLQVQIDIVDEAGRTEESMTILGPGRVSLGARETAGYLHADEVETDLAVIVQDGANVSINVKERDAQQPETRIELGPGDPGAVRCSYVMFIEALRRHLEVTQVFVDGDLLQGSAIIHKMAPAASAPPVMMSSSLVRRAQPLIAQGALEVTRELRELREQGKIDEHGDLIVPWPDDMRPDSPTDL